VNKKRTVKWQTVCKHAGLLVISFFWVYPFLWMTAAAFKTDKEFWADKFGLIPKTLTFDNISRVWNMAHFNTYFINTLIITVCSVALVMVMTNLSGYVLGRYSFIGKKLLMGIFLSSIAIPLTTTIIPVYQIIKNMGLIGTKTGVILAGAGGAHVIFILLYSSFYSQVPMELEEAAKLDGCGFFQTYFHVLRPMAKPVTGSVLIMETNWTWNAFMLPLVLTLNNPSSRTLAVGLYQFQGENSVDWTGIAAGGVIATIPIIILFLFTQQLFVEGVAGAVKN